MELCAHYELEFNNQSFSQFMNQLKAKHFDKSVKRHVLTKKTRDTIHENQKEGNLCKAKVTKGQFHLHHMVALTNGGNNHLTNIQVLCIPCHLQISTHE